MEKKNKRENMIKVSIYFHTSSQGVKLPSKTAYKAGIVAMPVNHKHGIKSGIREPFSERQQSLIDAIKECLKKNGIKLVADDMAIEYRKILEKQQKENFFDKEMKL